MKSICVYCGSSDLVKPKFLEAARTMGVAIAARDVQLVFGGGRTGLMGAVADAVMQAGGEVIGVIPHQFNKPELAHNGLTRLELVDDMHQRKARMIELSDAFIALPGGFGTLEEVFEALTWAQIGLHTKPIGLLNVDGYYNDLLKFLAHANEEGFTFHEHQGLYRHTADPIALLDLLDSYESPSGLERWLQR
ncbi:MAG: TIGR00730 family Rossman fold protein [Chloroflexi bacterium]|nr:TIGR00730 family Rossman fold protein [Chloroflexota bacterium]MQC27126.1 TIGR00730 family Rossman fold protein [Chloroflexota bacterium]